MKKVIIIQRIFEMRNELISKGELGDFSVVMDKVYRKELAEMYFNNSFINLTLLQRILTMTGIQKVELEDVKDFPGFFVRPIKEGK